MLPYGHCQDSNHNNICYCRWFFAVQSLHKGKKSTNTKMCLETKIGGSSTPNHSLLWFGILNTPTRSVVNLGQPIASLSEAGAFGLRTSHQVVSHRNIQGDWLSFGQEEKNGCPDLMADISRYNKRKDPNFNKKNYQTSPNLVFFRHQILRVRGSLNQAIETRLVESYGPKNGKEEKGVFCCCQVCFLSRKRFGQKKIYFCTDIYHIYICIHKYTNFNPHESETFLLKKTYLRS